MEELQKKLLKMEYFPNFAKKVFNNFDLCLPVVKNQKII